MTIEVREPVRIALEAAPEASATPIPTGKYAPAHGIVAFDAKDAKDAKLNVGMRVENAAFGYSDHLSRVVDHGMGSFGGGPNNRCSPQLMTHKEGRANVTATWRGFTASSSFEVRGTSK